MLAEREGEGWREGRGVFWSENLRSSEGEWGSDVMVEIVVREKRGWFGWRM